MAEKEYINLYECRDDFYATVLDILSEDCTNDRANQIIDAFDYLPTAAVAPVRHGHWIKNGYASKRIAIFLDNADEQYKVLGYPHRIILTFKCSECRMVSMVDESRGKYDYCPNCGAKMDEVEHDT